MMISRNALSAPQVAANARTPIVGAARPQLQLRRPLVVFAEPETAAPGSELENPDSETARKKAAADKLRAAEKFLVVGSGKATCKGCGYEYSPEKGDPDFPVAKGINFQDLPADYFCPICGAPKSKFESLQKTVAGFAENQKYGFGTNSMTGNQKLGLIYGALVAAFLLFLSGYAMN